MSVEWITYKGKRILLIDYSGMTAPQQLEQIRKAAQMLVDTTATDNLTLTDVSNTRVAQEFIDLAKEVGKISAPITKKAAIIGISGIRKILLRAVNTVSGNPRVPFDTVDEAKDWLVQ
jgi:hypothetical protein